MPEVPEFDPARLRRFLERKLGGAGDVSLERISGGQSNPTYFLDFAGRRMVLRKKPGGSILRGAHAVDREYRVLSALSPTDVPVPGRFSFCEDSDVIGTPFYLMERLDGRISHGAALPGVAPEERRALYLEVAAVLARLSCRAARGDRAPGFRPPGQLFRTPDRPLVRAMAAIGDHAQPNRRRARMT